LLKVFTPTELSVISKPKYRGVLIRRGPKVSHMKMIQQKLERKTDVEYTPLTNEAGVNQP